MKLWPPRPNSPSIGLSRYRTVRERMMTMLSDCLGTLFAEEAVATAKALGLWQHGGLVDQREIVRLSVAEAAAFHYRRGGETAIERMARTLPADAPALDKTIATGCLQYHWSIFDVLHIYPAEGAELRDTLDGATCRLWDEDGSHGLRVGELIAARLVPIDDWWVTSGTASAGIPVPIAEMARRMLPTVWHHPANWPPVGSVERDRLTLTLMAACHPLSLTTGPSVAVAPSRKQPCPCGSGKKFKHCCGRAH